MPFEESRFAVALFRASLGVAVAAAVFTSAGCGGGAPVSALCAGAGECGLGRTCVFSRCRATSEAPAPSDSARLALEPADAALISSKGPWGGGAASLPDSVSIGRASDGLQVLLLRFASPKINAKDVTSAYLVFDTVEGATPQGAPIAVETARIVDPWQGSTVSWGRRPRTTIPAAAALLRPAPKLRIDVTELVRGWWRQLPDDHGIAIFAEGTDPYGASVGLSGAERSPYLEVYVK